MQDQSRAGATPQQKQSLTHFAPVPRKCPRHDGWTPERQRAFIGALADTGCVKIAARMVNMAHASAYHLRRQPGAEAFRAAWDAAQSLGLQIVKDEAFDRAMNGQLVPVFAGGKLMGFRRKKNDRLLMFILRHYGQDAAGRKTTVNYFSSRATAQAGATAPSGRREMRSIAPTSARDAGPCRPATGEAVSIDVTNSLRDAALLDPPRNGEGDHAAHGGGAGAAGAAADPSAIALAAAQTSTTTVKTVISGASSPLAAADEAAALINAFEGVPLDAEARAEIARALAASAERHRALRTDHDTPHDESLARREADPDCDFIRVPDGGVEYLGELESGVELEEFVPFVEGEQPWETIGEPAPEWFADWQKREDARQAARALPAPEQNDPPRNGDAQLSHAPHGSALSGEQSDPSMDHPRGGGGGGSREPSGPVEGPLSFSTDAEQPISPRTGRRSPEPGRRTLKRYKKRTPKPRASPA